MGPVRAVLVESAPATSLAASAFVEGFVKCRRTVTTAEAAVSHEQTFAEFIDNAIEHSTVARP